MAKAKKKTAKKTRVVKKKKIVKKTRPKANKIRVSESHHSMISEALKDIAKEKLNI